VRSLRGIGDPLLAVFAAPRRHQCVQRIPVGYPVRFRRKARVSTPVPE
jgi:hypothetical protein